MSEEGSYPAHPSLELNSTREAPLTAFTLSEGDRRQQEQQLCI